MVIVSRKEIEQLRPWISSQVKSILGFSEDTVVNAAVDCLAKSLSRNVATELLSTFLDDNTDKFTKALYEKVQEIKVSKESSSSSSSKKRSARDAFGDEAIVEEEESSRSKSKRSSKEKDRDRDKGGGGAKKQKMIELMEKADSDGVELPPTAPNPVSQQQILSMLAQTKKEIETRKKQAQEAPPPPPAPIPSVIPQPVVIPAAAMRLYNNVDPALINETIEKAKRAAELQARIKNQLSAKPGLLASVGQPMPMKPTPLILDAEGRTVDAAGRTIQLSQRQPTLKANIRAQKRAQFKQIVQEKPKEKVEASSPFYDHRMGASAPLAPQRGKKMFKFHEPGKFQRLAQTMRAKAQLERLQGEIASTARKTGISSATKLALIAPSKEVYEDRVPDVEWWDAAILPTGRMEDLDRNLSSAQTMPGGVIIGKYCDISNLVEHPIPVYPPNHRRQTQALPIMLTKKERKKLRKQRRREEEKEKQEMIQFGLIPKPEPKVKMSNLMRVLGSEAVQDPTKVEAHVRAQIADRQKKHQDANEARKLTKEQKRTKKLKKLKDDMVSGIGIQVYRVNDLSNQSNKFKVDMNAQQHMLAGCVVLHKDLNMVIVQGGLKALKKFKRLMLHRIQWNPRKRGEVVESDDSDAGKRSIKKRNTCTLVWEGTAQGKNFHDWKFKSCPSEQMAREFLKKFGAEHYWDLALSESIIATDDDE
ncbi:U4/U6 small nuclear ribonucleoprotein Prp3-like [Dysidea avara]|uniref:U4/U6 small nuclear ribonucleoprotein Prp3-like n=1 Tax=Dysidea avara TaxID=196820 RepID=UPI003324F106